MDVSFKTDSKGFLSQECPSCERRFKALIGQGSDKPISHCPYCNHNGLDCWWTKEQVEYLGHVATSAVLGPELEKMAREFNRNSSDGFLKMSMKVKGPSGPSEPPREPEDEDFVTSFFACCGETVRHEPSSSVHCVICGTPSAA